MSSSSEYEYLENTGRPNWPGPVSLNTFLYLEPNAELDVFLTVVTTRCAGKLLVLGHSHNQHWKFQWAIGKTKTGSSPVLRLLEIVQEKNLMGQGDLNHLTNWGAVTVVGENLSPNDEVNILLKSMTLEQRKEFETISNGTRVKKPDGNWNCRDWCRTVLETAVERGLLTRPEVDRAVQSADEVEVRPYTH